MRHRLTFILILFVCEGCKFKNPFAQQADPLTDKTFTADKIGWTIQLPGENWKIIPNQEIERLKDKSKKEMEKLTDTTIDDSKTQPLINFRKNKINKFISAIMPYDIKIDGDYDKKLTLIHEFLKYRYESDKIPVEYEIGATRIGGEMMDWFNMKVFSPGKKKQIETVRMYSCLINNYFLSIFIYYNNEHDEETLMNVVSSSKFTNNK